MSKVNKQTNEKNKVTYASLTIQSTSMVSKANGFVLNPCSMKTLSAPLLLFLNII